MTFNFLGPGLTVNVEAKVKEQIILDSSEFVHISPLKNATTLRNVETATFRVIDLSEI